MTRYARAAAKVLYLVSGVPFPALPIAGFRSMQEANKICRSQVWRQRSGITVKKFTVSLSAFVAL
jgi:hypothetical protein